MSGIWHLCVLWLLCAGIEAQNRSQNRSQLSTTEVHGKRRLPFKSWNSQMYPVWKGTEAQKRDCWKGGQVTFNLQNDAPTLTGAKVTFYIQLNLPQNQTVLPDGQVVWSQNCTNNSTWVSAGEPVYPDESAEGSKCTFPDGRPFPQETERRRSKFVYVWQAWGKYWQVVDGPSSSLTVETDGITLGSHTMDVVVYHYRGRQKFIPIGSTSSQFAITDQIPISVSISQVLDLDQEDKRFVQNRAVSFSVAVHDPSKYLQTSDISFVWDFGDLSGTLLTQNTGVTHTYVYPGVFKAKVVCQASIPISPCGSASPAVTTAQGDVTSDLPAESTTRAATTNVVPSGTLVPFPSNSTLSLDVEDVQSVTDTSINVASISVEPGTDQTIIPTAVLEITSQVVVVSGEDVVEPLPDEGLQATQEVSPSGTTVVVIETAGTETEPAENIEESAVQNTEAGQGSSTLAPAEVTNLAIANEVEPVTEANGEVLLIAKRQAPEGPVGCLLYRYGTFSTYLDIVTGIASVQIVQIEPIVAAGLENAVDLMVTCQGSVPRQACTVISDPDCENPQQTVCNPVESSDCQLVLRQVFNDSGVYCVNVSLIDDVSLAVASAQVRVSSGVASSGSGIGVAVGVLLAAFAVATVAYTYRHLKSHTPHRTEHSSINWFPDRLSLRLFIQNALGRSINGENSPLLNGRVV